MVTTPFPEEKEPTKVEHLQIIARKALHEVVAGDPVSPVRRILLTVVSAVTILALASDGDAHPERLFIGGIGLVAVLLNSLTGDPK